ncbi:hypothetical protein [Exiguobacterium sp. s127]|uniref:DUF7878 domain-containing protein n=1 Tax=Exiguobacterium sp. s127 TaxID=2751210 RepID=UPI001BEA34FB|nr:hypothetical protein [Exiguobacterium sp. s127]
MVSIPGQIMFSYTFINQPSELSNRVARDVPTILSIEAMFTITINDEIYLETSLPILEFYKSLYRWKEKSNAIPVPEFHYYSLEFDDYEEGAIISMIPFSSQARIKSIWGEKDIYNVFPLDFLVSSLLDLEHTLKKDIEAYFDIQLEKFIPHIPYTLLDN